MARASRMGLLGFLVAAALTAGAGADLLAIPEVKSFLELAALLPEPVDTHVRQNTTRNATLGLVQTRLRSGWAALGCAGGCW